MNVTAGEKVGDPATGYATMSNPADVVTVVDPEQLEAFLVAEGHGESTVMVTDEAAALAVLAEHAPHLLAEVVRVPEWVTTAAKGRAKSGEAIPGIAIQPGKSRLTLYPTKELKAWAEKSIGEGLAKIGGAE